MATGKGKPWICFSLIALSALFVITPSRDYLFDWVFATDAIWYHYGLNWITAAFLHMGWGHFVFDAAVLYAFGDYAEEDVGHEDFLLLFLAATVAGWAFLWFFTKGDSVAGLGSAGGISGVATYYCVRYPNARIGIGRRFSAIKLPALLWLIAYIAVDLFVGWAVFHSKLAGALANFGGVAVGIAWHLTHREDKEGPKN